MNELLIKKENKHIWIVKDKELITLFVSNNNYSELQSREISLTKEECQQVINFLKKMIDE